MVMLDRNKKKLLGLTSALELDINGETPHYPFILKSIKELKSALRNGGIPLTMTEKVRIVKCVSRAKAKAYVAHDDAYRALDVIGSDLVQML